MNVAPPAPADVSEAGPSTVAPSKQVYSGSKKNWDEIETDLKKKEEEEKPEGEEALNKLFKDIYGRADVRAARRQDARALPARVPAPVAHVHGNCAWEVRGKRVGCVGSAHRRRDVRRRARRRRTRGAL
jgi:hypothetical protein